MKIKVFFWHNFQNHRRHSLLFWPWLVLGLVLATQNVQAERVIIGLHYNELKPALQQELQAQNFQIHRCFPLARLCVLQADRIDAEQLRWLRARPELRYVERDQFIQAAPRLRYKNDSTGTADCANQWELAAVGAEQAWAIADGTWAPVIAVEDTGFLLSHEELSGRVSGQYDYGNGDAYPEVEPNSTIPDHGTFIAALIVADPDNGVGRSGLAPYARFNAQKIADDDGALYFSYAIEAMADLADGDLGVRVLNYSIAGPTATQSFRDAIEALASVGILVVTAAGNCPSANCADADNDSHPMFPGSYTFDHIVTVAASSADDGFNTYSHYGRNSVDLAAPGVNICSAGVRSDHNYYIAGGTSYATPLVAATAALLLEAHPRLTTRDLARILRISARPSAAWTHKVRSGGVLDAAAALKTPMPRFARPGDQVIGEDAILSIPIANIAAAGRACLVVEHDPAIEIVAAREAASQTCWELRHTGPGQAAINVPDAGEVQSDQQALTVICGTIPSHETALLRLFVRGRSLGNYVVKTRVLMQTDHGRYLNSPYNAGLEDLSGFLAWSQNWRVNQLSDAQGDPCLTTEDAGTIQADAANFDTTHFDAARLDLGSPDAENDAANFDAVYEDAATPDTHLVDAVVGGDSAAANADASILDSADAAVEIVEPQACACSTTQGGETAACIAVCLLAFVAVMRRKRICGKRP